MVPQEVDKVAGISWICVQTCLIMRASACDKTEGLCSEDKFLDRSSSLRQWLGAEPPACMNLPFASNVSLRADAYFERFLRVMQILSQSIYTGLKSLLLFKQFRFQLRPDPLCLQMLFTQSLDFGLKCTCMEEL